jgi:hypothetical protein
MSRWVLGLCACVALMVNACSGSSEGTGTGNQNGNGQGLLGGLGNGNANGNTGANGTGNATGGQCKGAAGASCSDCLTKCCNTQVQACQNDAECAGLLDCGSQCASGDSACVESCVQQYPNGKRRLDPALTCAQQSCSASCG